MGFPIVRSDEFEHQFGGLEDWQQSAVDLQLVKIAVDPEGSTNFFAEGSRVYNGLAMSADRRVCHVTLRFFYQEQTTTIWVLSIHVIESQGIH